MGRSKKHKAGRGGGPCLPKSQGEGSRGERLRRRKEERVLKKAQQRRKMGRKPLKADKSIGQQGQPKENASKRRLELARLERLVAKQEDLLRDYREPKQVVPLDPELKRKRRRRDFYDLDTSHWKLTGAARPADSLPGASGKELANERGDWEAGVNLFETLGGGTKTTGEGKKGRFYDGPKACQEYLDLNHQLARTLHDDGEGRESNLADAQQRYRRCLELDPDDHVRARRGLVRLLLDAGDADEARAIVDRYPEDRGCEMAWSLAAIELVAWSVLSEEGSSEEVAEAALRAAYKANPFVAWNIAHMEIFDEVVEHADEISNPTPGTVEEAFWYMSRESGLWASLEGSSEWIADFLLGNEILPPNPHGVKDEGVRADEDDTAGARRDTTMADARGAAGGAETKFGGDGTARDPADVSEALEMFGHMFDTAVGMAAETAAQRLGIEDDEESRGEGGIEEDEEDDGCPEAEGGHEDFEGDVRGSRDNRSHGKEDAGSASRKATS